MATRRNLAEEVTGLDALEMPVAPRAAGCPPVGHLAQSLAPCSPGAVAASGLVGLAPTTPRPATFVTWDRADGKLSAQGSPCGRPSSPAAVAWCRSGCQNHAQRGRLLISGRRPCPRSPGSRPSVLQASEGERVTPCRHIANGSFRYRPSR
jgi:hypothetical protein